jgi:hypothetical protein
VVAPDPVPEAPLPPYDPTVLEAALECPLGAISPPDFEQDFTDPLDDDQEDPPVDVHVTAVHQAMLDHITLDLVVGPPEPVPEVVKIQDYQLVTVSLVDDPPDPAARIQIPVAPESVPEVPVPVNPVPVLRGIPFCIPLDPEELERALCVCDDRIHKESQARERGEAPKEPFAGNPEAQDRYAAKMEQLLTINDVPPPEEPPFMVRGVAAKPKLFCPGPKCRRLARKGSPYCSKVCNERCRRLRKKATQAALTNQEVTWLNRILSALGAWEEAHGEAPQLA